ncbi:MobP3 family relaxase [Erysipelothrix rhusiopathiae]|nr:MobP3 family relaxase [Erysipelothrix rhusiopathiae]
MARLIAKFGYMKPDKRNRSGFVEYIAKRDGVIKSIHNFAHRSVAKKQARLIEELINKFPKIVEAELFIKYQESQTIGSASELITHIEESSLQKLSNMHEYVQYIAQRPRVVKEGTHGLFSIHDDPLILEHVKTEIQNHPSNIWTAIISLKREDAARLGYDDLKQWKSLVRSKQNELAKHLKIDPNNFKWYSAFHDESHHPHIHLVMYAKDGKQGYLNQTSMDAIRSSFAREIFKDDLLHIYQKQTQARDDLKLASREYIQDQIQNINQHFQTNPRIEEKLVLLSKELETIKGKHQYGYLSKPIKQIVDEIVNEVSAEPSIQKLFDLWYQQRLEVLNTYSSKKEEIRNLSDLNEFKPIKNMVIQLAKEINLTHNPSSEIIKPSVTDQIDNTVHTLTQDYDAIDSDEVLNKHSEPDSSNIDVESYRQHEYKKILFPVSPSIKLLYQVSKLFESSMIQHAHTYQVDHKLIFKIRKQKIALGQHENDTHKN